MPARMRSATQRMTCTVVLLCFQQIRMSDSPVIEPFDRAPVSVRRRAFAGQVV
jgi:hypothetical protein